MLDIFDRVIVLKNSQFFSSVKTEDLAIVAKVLEEEGFSAGDIIFKRGDFGEQMFIVESGKIGISISDSEHSGDYVCVMQKGDCFGEMGLLDEQARSASAYVLEESKLLVLSKEKLKTLISNYPELSLGMLKSMSLRLRQSNEKLQNNT
ncbi:MAG: cyclic nucleotide-binding domain-containing protein [Gammaproteobacteria bacterium]|nr:cyclic nucleotide-binding domain-containing protein [Gammaproteobacteria bacterium]